MTITERICLLLHKSSLKQISTIFACLHTAATSTPLRNFGLNSKHDSNKSWQRLTTQQSSVISQQTWLCRSPSLIVYRRVQTQLELITVTFYTILIKNCGFFQILIRIGLIIVGNICCLNFWLFILINFDIVFDLI